jgi:competence protein ComEA
MRVPVTPRRTPGASTRGIPGLYAVLALLATAWLAATRDAARRPLTLPDARSPLTAWPDMRIDVNLASAGELTALPGIGPRLAERIVEERAAAGPFRSLEDVTRVKRVGPVLVARMRACAVVEERD